MRSDRLSRGCALLFSVSVFSMISATVLATPANAQERTAEYDFDIPAQTLAKTISSIADKAGLEVLYTEQGQNGVQARAIRGHMSADAALSQALAGTGYGYHYTRPKVITVVASTEGNGEGERVTSAVRVEGTQGSPYFGGAGQAAGVNGTNGSRDITATEGTKSFTSGALTIGSKAPQAMKDVPQSLSVITNERMQQQNITDFTRAMKQLPGVTVTRNGNNIGTNLNNRFFSRGFEITSFQVDGGAPLSTGGGFSPQIDMSVYDHIELLRGASGLFNGYGTPSGVINLVRKKPLDHPQYTLEAQAGSWSTYRIVGDASSPLALDGKLRGRLVMTYQDNHYFYNLAKDNKTVVYGIAELDVTPTTTLSAGIDYTRQNSLPWYGGLPRYQTGADLGLPRSTSFAFPWNRQNFDTTQIFGTIEQKIGSAWTLKLNLTNVRQQSTQKVGTSINSVDPVTKTGPALYGYYRDYGTKQLSAEALLTGAFEIFGQRQEVTIGANRATINADGSVTYADLISQNPSSPYQPYPGGPRYCYDFFGGCPAGTIAPSTPPINVFNFNPNLPIYTEPSNPVKSTGYAELGTTQSGVYINVRLTAFDRLHLQTGLRWSRYENSFSQIQYCRNTTGACAGKQVGDIRGTSAYFYSDNDLSWPPPVNLSFDISKELTAYAGYTDIYQSQANFLTVDRKPIDPITGSNWEAGLKWAAYNGRLNVTLSAYQIKQNGFAMTDPLNPTFVQVDNIHVCCYVGDPNNTSKSQGFDLEATGELLPGWQVAASYTYSENKREGSTNGALQGMAFLSIQPKNLYKLWMSYDFGAAGKTGLLSGVTISGGVNGQSSGFYQGSGCKPEFVITDNFSGGPACAAGGTFNFNYTVAPYAVFSSRLDYRVSDKWSLAINLENIFDKVYYSDVGGDVYGGNWYGTPRSVTATLRARW